MAVIRKKSLIRPKKIPYYLALTLLTTGASLILGFLSFGGMYAISPILPLALATFGLSVAYEGEIYLQNISKAFKKLFKSMYLENYLAQEYLTQLDELLEKESCPIFFKDYTTQLKLLEPFKNKQLSKENTLQKKTIEKTLSDMQKWFAQQLFATQDTALTDYTKSLREWLKNNEHDKWQKLLESRQATFNYVKAFSVLAAAFMCLGSTYLIVEAFSVIPLVAAIPFTLWPIMILPMALIAGISYGMLTYNTMTDLINNDTLNKWFRKIRDSELSIRSVFIATMAVFLTGIALTLTVCTAGTWWTIATNARPLFEWMRNIPGFVMGIINPTVVGLATTSFNIENIAESLEMLDEATNTNTSIFRRIYKHAHQGLSHLIQTENWLQWLNPFRILLKLSITPLRILFFLGHLASFALTADRMPGVPQIVSVLIGMISEGFEDAHYFVEDYNIPSRFISTLATPLQALAASWDWLASKRNNPTQTLSFSQAWNKQRGIPKNDDVSSPDEKEHPSEEWKIEHTVFLIEKYQKKQLNQVVVGAQLASRKNEALNELKLAVCSKNKPVKQLLEDAEKKLIYNHHRLFTVNKDAPTNTRTFIDSLSYRVNAR